MSELEMDTHAAYAAEYFWWIVRRNVQSQKVLKEDLLDRLNGDEQDASYAFSLFDLDGDGYVVEEEVQSRFQKIYRYATRHTPHATSHKPHTTRHTPQATRNKPHATSHTPQATHHTQRASVDFVVRIVLACHCSRLLC